MDPNCCVCSLILFAGQFTILSSENQVYSTDEIWTKSGVTYRRPPWSGNVIITYDESQIWNIFGIILPISTSDRPSAPEPWNGYDTGTALSLDKGHFMALSNGGPDIEQNIVPQSASWQRYNGWRDLEETIYDHALSKYGWDPDDIYHASEIINVADPGSWNYVTFNLSMFDYDVATGEPMRYQGKVQSGKDTLYGFTITPENDAIWDDDIVPPDDAVFVASTPPPKTDATPDPTSNPSSTPTATPTEYQVYSTDEIWTKSGVTYRRPSWSGDVIITYDESQIWNIFGVILPISTNDRPSAPDPWNGYDTGTALSLDKGHLMALSNGGPDIEQNIVPQSASWQRYYGWRDLEEAICDHALSKYGWDPDDIYHASEIINVTDPGSWNYVTFNLSMFDYDVATGQPMRYQGTVQSGTNTFYEFTITPEYDAIWENDIVSPDNAVFVASTSSPTRDPSSGPTIHPSLNPTLNPTADPSSNPTLNPSANPTENPTSDPSSSPTVYPTSNPTGNPSSNLTSDPTSSPTSTYTTNIISNPLSSPTDDPEAAIIANSTDSPTTEADGKEAQLAILVINALTVIVLLAI